jgi:hypothetical protein
MNQPELMKPPPVAQSFFAQLAAETRRPHYGHHALEWTRALLIRAQECGLYDPTAEVSDGR